MLLGLSNKQAVILVDNATKREYFVRPKRIKASQLWFASLDRTILACRHLALYGTRLLCPMASYSQNIVTKNMATCTCLSSFCMVLGPRPRWSCVAHVCCIALMRHRSRRAETLHTACGTAAFNSLFGREAVVSGTR
mgnify:CR=1 FL=1